MPALLRSTDSLESHWEELVYTEARLLAADHKTLAAQTTKSIKKLTEIQSGQLLGWRREIIAQAHVDACDDSLDDGVEGLSRDVLHLESGNRKSARFKLYFKTAVSAIVRMGLEAQIPVVRGMLTALMGEPEKVLKDRAKSLAAILKKGDEAIVERREAAGARAAHRAREILSLVDNLNAERTAQHAELTLYGNKNGLPRDYADRFFRRTTRTARSLASSEPKPEE
jgi:hypothetical protein